MNVIKTTEAIITHILTDGTIISALMAISWLILVFAMLQLPIPRKRAIVFICLFVVIQWGFNFFLQFTNYNYIVTFVSEIIVFTIQSCLMIFIFSKGTKGMFLRILSSVAFAYFIIHAFVIGLIQITLPWELKCWEAYPDSFWIVLLSAILFDAIPYLITLGYSCFVRYAMKKSRFALFFKSLFSTKLRSVVTCIFCVLFMHSTRIINLLLPVTVSASVYYFILAALEVCFLLALLLVSVFETNREKLRTQQAYIIQQNTYLTSLERMQQEVRSFRHDFQNLMSGLWLQASEGDLEGVRQRVKSTLNYFDENIDLEVTQATQLIKIEIVELKSLVMVKLMEMHKQNIAARIEVLNPVTACAMEIEDLLRCLGILLDNAIEASLECQRPWVSLVIYQEDMNNLGITVINPVLHEITLHQLMKPGYSTKGKERGVGLKNLHRIISVYSGTTIKTTCKNGQFTQELQIRRK